MPHADSSFIPDTVKTKEEFWAHVHAQVQSLIAVRKQWVTNLSNASSVIYYSLLGFPAFFGDGERMVNWCGFYIDESLFPPSCILPPPHASIPYSFTAPRQPSPLSPSTQPRTLLLGPFCGRPACQYVVARQTGGVCSAAYLRGETVRVDDVHAFEGHIACDVDTKSEVVVPLVYTGVDGALRVLGVLDLDCVATAGFDDVDVRALERIAGLVVQSCEWAKE